MRRHLCVRAVSVIALAWSLGAWSGRASGAIDDEITLTPPPGPAPAQWWVDARVGSTGMQRCGRAATISTKVRVWVLGVVNLHSYRFAFHYDPAQVRVLGVTAPTLFLDGGPATTPFVPTDDGAGKVTVAVSLAAVGAAVSGDGPIAEIELLRLDTGGDDKIDRQTGIDIDPNLASLVDHMGQGIPADPRPGKAQVVFDVAARVGCWTVNAKSDLGDLEAGDGICDVDPAPGVVTCTLRAAIAAGDGAPRGPVAHEVDDLVTRVMGNPWGTQRPVRAPQVLF